MPVLIVGGAIEPVFIIPQQLPTMPIEPPDPAAGVYGMMTWDLPSAIAYSPYQEITGILEAWNPTSVDRLYAIAYYFLNPQGAVVTHDYLYFTMGGSAFSTFILHAGAPERMVTTVLFKAPGVGYRFGLQMLELEAVGTEAVVKYETCRLEILLGGEGTDDGIGRNSILDVIIPGMLAVTLTAVVAKTISKK